MSVPVVAISNGFLVKSTLLYSEFEFAYASFCRTYKLEMVFTVHILILRNFSYVLMVCRKFSTKNGF